MSMPLQPQTMVKKNPTPLQAFQNLVCHVLNPYHYLDDRWFRLSMAMPHQLQMTVTSHSSLLVLFRIL